MQEIQNVSRDRPVFRRQDSLTQGEAPKRIGTANEERHAPSEIKREAAPSLPETVVDLHTHLFDARYMPLEEILQRNGVPERIAGPAKKLFDLLAGKADFVTGPHREVIDGVGEDESLKSLADLLTTTVSRDMAERILAQEFHTSERRRSVRGDGGLADLRSDELFEILEEIEDLAWPEAPEDFARRQFAELVDLIDESEGASGQTGFDRLEHIGEWVKLRFSGALLLFLEMMLSTIRGDASGTALDFVKFFLLMFSKESAIREALFSGHGGNQNVDLVAQTMMETQQANGDTRSNLRLLGKTNTRMAAVTEGSHGDLAEFVAFDVRRPDALRIVKYSWRGGTRHVRIEFPMVDPAYGIDATQQERFGVLFPHCAQEGIPILTHCSPVGLEAFKGQKIVSDPDYWLEVLDDHRDLKLCYGHAGGGGDTLLDRETGNGVRYFGWCSENDEEWAEDHNFARKVVEQCCRFPNVFCDFSYFGAIVKTQEKATHLKRNLITALGGPNGDLHFGRKIMYGSDWHMPKMGEHAADLLAFWREVFDDPLIAQHRDAFFFKNALRFLGTESLDERHPR